MKSIDYETLASLPLFMGIDGVTLSEFCNSAHPVDLSVRPGSMIAATGSDGRMLTIVIEGEVKVITSNAQNKYELEEFLYGCNIIEPQRFFGLHPAFARTYVAQTSCRLLRLPKNNVVSQLLGSEVFRLNFINTVCTIAQQYESRLSTVMPASLEQRVAAFVTQRALRPVGRKLLHIKMTDLSEYLTTSRLTLSHTLHAMSSCNLLELHRRHIVIPALENLIAAAK